MQSLPPLDGMSYTRVFAGRYRTVLLTFLKMMMKSYEIIVRCFGLDGVEVLQLRAGFADLK